MRQKDHSPRRTIGYYIHIGDATDMQDVLVCAVRATASGRVLMQGFETETDTDVTAFFHEVTEKGLREMVEAITGKKVA